MWKATRLLLLASCCLQAAAAQVTNQDATPPEQPAICDVCKCTKAANGQSNVHCADAVAAFELTRDDVWPAALRSISVNHAQLSNMPRLPRQKLHALSLAHNELLEVPDEAFAAYDLEELDLGFNGLKALREGMLRGVENLTVLRAPHNSLVQFEWDTVRRLEHLQQLHLQDNFLSNLSGAPGDLHNLEVLNLSGNSLSDFPVETCSGLVKLRELHLANNQLATVPSCLQSHLGALQFLVLDGNQIATVPDDSFAGLASLHSLSLSNLRELREVPGGALRGLAALRHFHCANNAALERVHKSLFFMGDDKIQHDWSLNTIDLSNNNIKKIPKELVPWEIVSYINLQGNPWDCGCDSQWMLDTLLPILYNKNSSMLEDFRCWTPAHLASRRLVYWLGHAVKPFCDGAPHPETQVTLLQSGSSQGMLIALSVIAGAALLLLVVGFVLQRRYERQRRDLATRMGRCRRPRNGDVRLTNPKFGI